MLFNSQVFLYGYLPVTLIGFLLLARRAGAFAAQLWLTLASIVFYAWTGWPVLWVLLLSILVNFFVGRVLVARAAAEQSSRLPLIAGIVFNLLLLGYFKYAHFIVDSLGLADRLSFGEIALPIGISFYTFTQIAFLVDAARRQAEPYDLPRYGLFVTFFPHLIAGPIIHHKEMMPQFADPKTYVFSSENLAVGFSLFAMGLFKKVVFADRIAPFASPVFSAAETGAAISFGDAWIAALAYTLQIYFDFSAYSDMAIGLARMFGVHLPINFNSPYKSRSIVEFWRRWHMTLSRFLRDYVYIPLGGNRHGKTRRYVNLIITMLLGGLWHGANWTFVVWGGLHGVYLAINHAWGGLRWKLPDSLALGLTFLATIVAWIFFRAESFSGATAMLRGLVGSTGLWEPNFVGIQGALYALPMLIVALWAPNTQQMLRDYMPASFYDIEPPRGQGKTLVLMPTRRTAALVSFVFLIACLLIPKASEFLYFQF
ncbi:MAG: MBOAT family protein [Alphaproteobacteria bacterium]|nr:MBOAT family protein [Alphaproteobacteria bacterium]